MAITARPRAVPHNEAMPRTSPPRTVTERTRLLVVAPLGLVAGGIAAIAAPWQLAVLIGWDIAATTLLVWVWVTIGRTDGPQTRALALSEDNSRTGSWLVLLGAAVFSLVGAVFAFVQGNNSTGALKGVLVGGCVLTVAVSWVVVHTVFTLRYAHLYYSDDVGGIDFGQDITPDYHDFAYVAFTVGATFQVSDTDVTHRDIRHAVLHHALLSYLFGALIVAFTINAVAGLAK